MKTPFLKAVLPALLALGAVLAAASWHAPWWNETRADTTGGEQLSPYMATMQYHTHKVGLSIQARNRALADFYLGELEETLEIVRKKFPTYDQHDIADLAGAMLAPSLPPVDKALTSSNWPEATRTYEKLVDACNDCHAAADHEFVKVTVPAGNPFNQTFSPK